MLKITILFFVVTIFVGCAEESYTASCSIPATVKDLSGLDGCGFVFELENGTRLEPYINPRAWCGTPPLAKEVTEDPLYNFQFVDGKKVFIEYLETDMAGICMVGEIVKITCISEAITQSDL